MRGKERSVGPQSAQREQRFFAHGESDDTDGEKSYVDQEFRKVARRSGKKASHECTQNHTNSHRMA